MNENAVQAKIKAVDKALVDLKDQLERGYIEIGQYTRLKMDLERQKAELEMQPPQEQFDPCLLDDLQAPGGTVKLHDKFYIERDADARLKREVLKSGVTITIRAPRQTGKSSLLARGIHEARQNGAWVVYFDLQRVDQSCLGTPETFLKYLARTIISKLRLDPAEVDRRWYDAIGPQENLTALLEEYVLLESGTSILLAIDEADALLSTTFYKGFFGMIRSWHNSRAIEEQWNKLNIALVISTEPAWLISNSNQSPFNVGLRLGLEDFDDVQVHDLDARHGSPVERKDLPQLMALLGGHPYLTRQAFYTLVTRTLVWAELLDTAADDQGPFGEHLRHYADLLRNEPELSTTLRHIIGGGRHTNKLATFRLLRTGLVKSDAARYVCRCDLYRQYFEGRL